METATVKYQIATYSGTIEVSYDPNDDDDDDVIIAKAKKLLRQKAGSFPLGYQSFKIINRT